MDVRSFNREAWDRYVERENIWTKPVSHEEIETARAGDIAIVLTPKKAVPRAWLEPLAGLDVLCLASAGGQQAPLLAAAGARVVSFDNSPKQLEQDRRVAEREGLALELVEGDMRDLSRFEDASFDLIVNPCSTCFVPDVRPVFRECARVLRTGGRLLSGAVNPVAFVWDPDLEKQGAYTVKFAVPYSDLTSLSAEDRERHFPGEPLAFGHTLEDLLQGQIDAGLVVTGFYDDVAREGRLAELVPCYFATRAEKR